MQVEQKLQLSYKLESTCKGMLMNDSFDEKFPPS